MGELRVGLVDDLQAALPAAQAPVGVLEGHLVVVVEHADALDRFPLDVEGGPGGGEHGRGHVGRAVGRLLEAVPMVEPLGRAEVAVRAGGLDAAIGVEQLGCGHADAVALVGGLLEGLEPTAVGDDVAVEEDDVSGGAPQAAVGVASEAELLVALDDLGTAQADEALSVLGVRARVVADEDAGAFLVGRPEQRADAFNRHVRVAIGGDDDGHVAPVVAVPAPGLHPLGAVGAPVAEPAPDRGGAQGERDRAQQRLARAEVLEGEPGAAGEAPDPSHARPSNDNLRRTPVGSRFARDPRVAPIALVAWWGSDLSPSARVAPTTATTERGST